MKIIIIFFLIFCLVFPIFGKEANVSKSSNVPIVNLNFTGDLDKEINRLKIVNGGVEFNRNSTKTAETTTTAVSSWGWVAALIALLAAMALMASSTKK